MSSSFQNEIPKARVNLKLDLHTGGAKKKVELPLKLLVAGDFSNGQEERPLSERIKMDINNNMPVTGTPFHTNWSVSVCH
ncbi:TPA: type VI secretion system contractile sheath small subunit [Escherichia coli]|nr:type VI secretion system contractile sheath small subunit [Escherichia coli]HBA9523084.1 type VI secretion system contractile sheath small subunit [Escherichia coli]HBA9551036.1 type VI secretion system contractile sheath small subunit [Escherichia coli]HBA9560498.1 type VI secretion system contractile sheath small subunit [Escherichia coli]